MKFLCDIWTNFPSYAVATVTVQLFCLKNGKQIDESRDLFVNADDVNAPDYINPRLPIWDFFDSHLE